MLVLSRKCNERINFPNLGIAVEVLRVSGNTVRVGVEAPQDVRVLRGELIDEEFMAKLQAAEREERHAIRNHLNSLNLALHLLQKQLDAGQSENAETTLSQVLNSFAELERSASARAGSKGDESREGRRALVVEDNANERELLSGYLRLCGYEVESVEDGVAALNYLSENARPDLVLLDMQMPRMGGCETISEIRRNPAYRDIKLFVVSGMDQEEQSEQQPVLAKVDRWFAKPLKPAEFANELEAELASA